MAPLANDGPHPACGRQSARTAHASQFVRRRRGDVESDHSTGRRGKRVPRPGRSDGGAPHRQRHTSHRPPPHHPPCASDLVTCQHTQTSLRDSEPACGSVADATATKWREAASRMRPVVNHTRLLCEHVECVPIHRAKKFRSTVLKPGHTTPGATTWRNIHIPIHTAPSAAPDLSVLHLPGAHAVARFEQSSILRQTIAHPSQKCYHAYSTAIFPFLADPVDVKKGDQ